MITGLKFNTSRNLEMFELLKVFFLERVQNALEDYIIQY